MKDHLIFIFTAVLFFTGTVYSDEGPLFIGFIENSGEAYLRIAFDKKQNQWRSLCPTDKDITSPTNCRSDTATIPLAWTIAHSGKAIGSVATDGYLSAGYYSKVGLAQIRSEAPVPRIGERSNEFSGWSAVPVYQPLVAVTGKYYDDPERWTPSSAQNEDMKALWPLFRQTVGVVQNCHTDAEGNERYIKWDYHQNDVTLARAFSSIKGAHLISMKLKSNLNKCDGPPGREWSTFWFLVDADKTPLSLQPHLRHPESEYQLIPIDFGDYDGDGKSEALFWISSYNEDGYVVFFDTFSRYAEFTWIYH